MDAYDDPTDEPGDFSISCTDVPEALFDQDAAVNHFERFGTVTKILLQPKKYSCIIHYDNRESANRAVNDAGAYDGFMFSVSLNKKKRRVKDDDPEWLPDPEVAAELAAMSRDGPMQRLNRQKKMEIDPDAMPYKKAPIKKLPVKDIDRKKSRIDKPPIKPIQKPTSVQINEEELLQLINKQWIKPEDKLNALEIRDRLLRVNLQQRHGAIKGCCPDMCPERERLTRLTQRTVSNFELNSDGFMDVNLALKEYSRSSADQEEPLAHELRPEPVLHQSLLYLLHHIVEISNDEESSLGDWFHFMWDRLRAIRKDIAQQELCCRGTVSLVEACARFHAHCAARLVEELPSSFDQRLNTENLSKCLQSLKYMYNDLRARGESDACVNEPEFRAYVILLNMHDANFMWEVQKLSPEVQSSPEVQFAISVFTALDNNNYIRFFKLVRETTYLNACILMRYFNHVRLQAIQRMIKAYSPRGMSTFPANDLLEMLGFESIDSMIGFLEHYNLRMNYDNFNVPYVMLDRSSFSNLDAVYQLPERAVNLIESKIHGSLSEVIYGGPLGEYNDDYRAHTSFDENNYMKKESILAQDQGYLPSIEIVKEVMRIIEKKPFESTPAFKPAFKPLPEKKFTFTEPAKSVFNVPGNQPFSNPIFDKPKNFDNLFKNEAIKINENQFSFSKPMMADNANENFAKSVFGEKTHQIDPKNIFSSFKPDKLIQEPLNVFGSNSSKQFVTPCSITFGQKPFSFSAPSDESLKLKQLEDEKEKERKRLEAEELEKSKQEEQRKLELEKAKEKERQFELAKQKAEQEKREKLEKEKKIKDYEDSVNKCLETEVPELIDGVVRVLCEELCTEELNELENIRIAAEDVLKEIVDDLCDEAVTADFKVSQRLNELRINTILRRTITQWKFLVARSNKRRLLLNNTPTWLPTCDPPKSTVNQTQVLERMRDFHRGKTYHFRMPPDDLIKKINVFEEVKKHLLRRSQESDRVSFSSSIFWKLCVSLPCRKENNAEFAPWVNSALADMQSNSKKHLLYLKEKYWLKKYYISVCKADDALNSDDSVKALTGANGYLIYADIDHRNLVLERFENLMASKCELDALPVAFILHISSGGKLAAQQLKERLFEYKNKNLVSAFKISTVVDYSDEVLSFKTIECLKWLSKHRSVDPQLEMNRSNLFLDQCIGKELWCRFKLDLRSSIREAFENCNHVIDIYNEAVEKTLQIACDPDLYHYPQFAEEFHIYLTSNDIYPKDYKYFPRDWKDNIERLKQTIRGFKITNKLERWPPENWAAFQLIIKRFIEGLNWFKDTERVYLKVLSIFIVDDLLPDIRSNKFDASSWLNIMEVLVAERIFVSCDSTVVYSKARLDNYRTIPWWYRLQVMRGIKPHIDDIEDNFLDDTLEDLGVSSIKKAKFDLSMESLDDDLMSSIMIDMDKSAERTVRYKEMMANLEKTISEHSAKQAEFEAHYKTMLGD